jgi:hypothetical protein
MSAAGITGAATGVVPTGGAFAMVAASSAAAVVAAGVTAGALAAASPAAGIRISLPSLIRSGLPPMNASGFAAKMRSARFHRPMSRPVTRAAIVDSVSPCETR